MNLLETITNTKEAFLHTLSNGKKNICDFFDEETTVTRKTITVICVISALTGIIYGFLIAPIKKGIRVNVSIIGENHAEKEEQKNNKVIK